MIRGAMLLLVLAGSAARAQDTTAIRRKIVALEERIGTANLTCDYNFFRAIEAPEFIFTDARGNVTTRAEDLAGEKSCKPQKGTYVLDELRLQYHGNVVVFSARSVMTIQRDTQPPAVFKNRFTDVLVRRDTSWVLVSGHSSRIP